VKAVEKHGKSVQIREGDRFTRLLVIRKGTRDRSGQKWLTLCDCGNVKEINQHSLTRGLTKSCGCIRSETAREQMSALHSAGRIKKPLSNGCYVNGKPSPTYVSYRHMLARCYDKNNNRYEQYGSKGIRVCSRWRGKDGFRNFLSDLGPRLPGTSLGRINGNKGYTKSNCEWQDGHTQALEKWARQRKTQKREN